MPEETKAAPFGPILTPAAPDEEATGLDVAREKLLRPKVRPPAAAMVAAAMKNFRTGFFGFVSFLLSSLGPICGRRVGKEIIRPVLQVSFGPGPFI